MDNIIGGALEVILKVFALHWSAGNLGSILAIVFVAIAVAVFAGIKCKNKNYIK